MQTLETLYSRTNCGLDILRLYYPFLDETYASRRKKFSIRVENVPSCSVRLHNGCYRITDFGDDSREMSPIDVVMAQEKISFEQALKETLRHFGIPEEEQARKPYIHTVSPAKAGDTDFFYMARPLTPYDARIFGRNVEVGTLKKLNWEALAYYSVVSGERKHDYTFNENSRAYIRKCHYTENDELKCFFKLYFPHNDKKFRFVTYPKNAKPRNYINGLYEIVQDMENGAEETPEGGGGKTKLNDVFLCSGERDAVCLKQLGCYPLWLNSETSGLQSDMFAQIESLAKNVYNIPDIDETGVRQGELLANKYKNLATIWLPDELREYKDSRGNPCKDLRDYCEFYSPADFSNLIKRASKVAFWQVNPKTGNYCIDVEYFLYFLKINGFGQYKDTDTKQSFFIRKSGSLIERIDKKDISEFVKQWARDNNLSRNIRNMILSSRMTEQIFDNLDYITFKTMAHSKKLQTFHFLNTTVMVTPDEVTAMRGPNLFYFDDSLIKHNFRRTEQAFEYETSESGFWRITPRSLKSKFFCFLINSSRIYWRKEFYTHLDALDNADKITYLNKYRFSLDSEILTEKEKDEQNKILQSKIFTIGYLLHKYKDPSKPWAAYAMDWRFNVETENNGRTGKSFFFKFLDVMANCVKLSGRNKHLLDNQHVFDQVTRFTDVIIIDDCNKNITPEKFFDKISGDLNVNPKNKPSFTIPYEQSPKFAFTTNYVPKNFDPSSVGRLLFLVFSDYYHIATSQNDYREDRSIYDDFGLSLFNDYTESHFNDDINFFLECVSFYLKASERNIKIQPPLYNIEKRSYSEMLSDSFEDWASSFFAPNSTNLNVYLDRLMVYGQCKAFTGNSLITSQSFLKQLKAFCSLSEHIGALNPKELCTSGNRILKTVNGATREYIYVKTI